jgi:hypothetical protein
MAKVTIYQFEVYDIQSDQIVKSKRWGTAKGINKIACDQMLEDTAAEVDDSVIYSDIHGFTPIGFDPQPGRPGFQTKVRR